jgi:hypothetical protein
VRIKVLTEVVMGKSIFWDKMPYGPVKVRKAVWRKTSPSISRLKGKSQNKPAWRR